MTARILLVDDEEQVLRGLSLVLRQEPFELAWAKSADEALRWVEAHPVDLIVSDDRMPGLSGTAMLAQLYAKQPNIGRVVLTGSATLESALAALNDAHVFRLLRKPCPPELLKRTLHEALAAQAQARLTQQLMETAAQLAVASGRPQPVRSAATALTGVPSTVLGQLTLREREVLELLVLGRRIRQVAEALFVSPHTVRNHVKALFRKLGVHSQEALVALAAGR